MVALAGFHIKRQEFEPEYDNEAEMIVADMEFRDDDTEVGMHARTFLSHHQPESLNCIAVVDAFWLMIIAFWLTRSFIHSQTHACSLSQVCSAWSSSLCDQLPVIHACIPQIAHKQGADRQVVQHPCLCCMQGNAICRSKMLLSQEWSPPDFSGYAGYIQQNLCAVKLYAQHRVYV